MSITTEQRERLRDIVHEHLMFDTAPFWDLHITDNAGGHPVVTATSDEPLAVLVQRIRNVGGCANVFVQLEDGSIARIDVLRPEDALDTTGADHMVNEQRPSLAASVGMFVEYLMTQQAGVVMPSSLGMGEPPKAKFGGRVLATV